MPDPLWIDAGAGAPAYSAAELRRAMAAPLLYSGRDLGGRAGVRPGGTGLVTQLAGSTITVKAGVAIVDPALSVTQGPYWVAIDTDETHTLTPAHASFPRKDITVLRVYDTTEDSSGLRTAVTEYIVGTASATPAEPSVPAGAIRLATIDVPASGGGSAVVTVNFQWSVTSGGTLPVRNLTERNALPSPFHSQRIYRMDMNWHEVYWSSAWRVEDNPAVCTSTAVRDTNITAPWTGQMVLTTDTNTLWRWTGSAWTEYYKRRERAEGSFNVSVAAGGFVNTAVVFPVGRFSVAPHVNLTSGSGRLNLAVSNITASGCDVGANNWTGGASGSVPVYWQAMEKV